MTQPFSRMFLRAAVVSGGVMAMSALMSAPAQAQTAASATAPKTVTVLSNAQMTDAFKKVLGPAIITTDEYKIMAAHRDEGGGSEIHQWDTDVFYVVDGSATLVTGGKMTQEKTTAPGELRGAGIDGGTPQKVSKGDVVIIPRGVPHWFKDVSQAPFLYFVVKTTAAH